MRFVTIKTPKIPIPRGYPEKGVIEEGSSIAVNVDNICSIEHRGGMISLFLSNEEEVLTMFTTIEAAVDYIQRAPRMSMGVSQ